jgi:protein TonB
MKWILFFGMFAEFFLTATASSAQEKISYIDKHGDLMPENEASIIQQQIKLDDTTFIVNTYMARGAILSSIGYRDEKSTIPSGRYIKYNKQGEYDTVGHYVRGRREGTWYVRYMDGMFSLNYSAWLPQSNEACRLVSHPADTGENKLFTKVEIEAEFKGGNSAWMHYLDSTLHYPEKALARKTEGTVTVRFLIHCNGSIDPAEIYIDHSVGFYIDREAIRLIKNSPDWEPTTQNDRQIPSYKVAIIPFRIKH